MNTRKVKATGSKPTALFYKASHMKYVPPNRKVLSNTQGYGRDFCGEVLEMDIVRNTRAKKITPPYFPTACWL